MSKISFIGIAIVLASTIWLWLFTNQTKCRFRGLDRLVISPVESGSFVEWIPVTGIFLPDTGTADHHVRVQIDEMHLRRIAMGQKATTRFEDSLYALELVYIYPQVVNGRITVDMNFVGAMPTARAREPLRMRLELSKPTAGVLLPVGNFYWHTDGDWVFVLEGITAVKRNVRLGRKNADYFEVLEGLKPGELVITSSYEHFKDRQTLALSLVANDD